MKHDDILRQLIEEAEKNPNILAFLVFGSVASGTQREDSDIDTITIFKKNNPSSGIRNTVRDGIKVGNIFLTYDILVHSVETVPYLLHPLGGAKLLLDRDQSIQPLFKEIRAYFTHRPEIEKEWDKYYKQLREEKAQFGHEKTTIIDVWNQLEKHYSQGKTKRRFFNSFYLTNPYIFSILKRFL